MLQSTMGNPADVFESECTNRPRAGEGLDDQHMFAEYGRARSGECIKARLCVTGDDDNRDTLSRTARSVSS